MASHCSFTCARLSWIELFRNRAMQLGTTKDVDDAMRGFTYRLTIVVVLSLFALAGCERKQSQTPQQSTANQTPAGRSQTRALRAASAVGYDGKQLQKQVDQILEQKEKRDRDLENKLTDPSP